MDSDTDSEHDRRAYGQYTSLAVDGDEHVDEEAAAYLRAVRSAANLHLLSVRSDTHGRHGDLGCEECCRAEARGIPDVMISPKTFVPPTPAIEGEEDYQQPDNTETTAMEVTSSPAWIRGFMKDFLDLRLRLQRHVLGPEWALNRCLA